MSTGAQPAPVTTPSQPPAQAGGSTAKPLVRKVRAFEISTTTLFIVGLIVWAGMFAAQSTNMWLLILGSLIVFVLFLGRWISGRPLGIFIGERNLMSISRFQMVLWTILILSAYLTMCLHRVRDGSVDPLNIGMDWHLWALMGISTTSLIGSPLLLGNKAQKDAHPDAVQKAVVKLQDADVAQNMSGTLYANPSVKDASFADMFQGDEIGNTFYIDVGKVQMFFFTLIGVIVYGAALFHLFRGGDYHEMPKVSDGLIALLGISHGGYLASKVPDHTPTTQKT